MRIATGQTEIRASAEDVWEILTDFQSFSSWNPFLYSGEGSASVGSKPKFVGLMGPGKSMAFSPKVTVVKPGQELEWVGRLLIPGLFDGRHKFLIKKKSATSVTFEHSEEFSGTLVCLAPLLFKRSNVQQGFESMNTALKARAERS